MKHENLTVLLTGGIGYGLIELCWRGRTHWTMVLTGGLCLWMLYRMDLRWQGELLVLRCIKGAVLITCLELAMGLLVNVLLGWEIWDYSRSPGNLLGQICPLYSLLWYFLCYPIFLLTRLLRRQFHPQH